MEHVTQYLSQIRRGNNVIYRGHANTEWELKPSIGRHYDNKWSNVLKF